MSSFAQFIDDIPQYRHLNRMVNYLELFKIATAQDGKHFDDHLDLIFKAENSQDYGNEAEMISRLEITNGSAVTYQPSESENWPITFLILQDIASMLGKDKFVEALMGPSGIVLPRLERIGFLMPEKSELRRQSELLLKQHCIQFSGLFEPKLLEELHRQTQRARFGAMLHGELGVDFTMDFGLTQLVIAYLTSDRRLLEFVENTCDLEPSVLRRLSSRVYRMVRGRDDDTYHDDVHHNDHRLVGMTMALHRKCPAGGALYIKRQGWLRPYATVRPENLGDLTLFRISRHLRHRAGSVRDGGERTVFVGWLCANSDFDYESWLNKSIFAEYKPLRRLVRRAFALR